MDALRHGRFRLAAFLSVVGLAMGMAGCDGDDGDSGPAGATGVDGAAGSDGISCWDLNENGVGDLPDEDLNGDGVVDVLDCNVAADDGGSAVEVFHKSYFAENAYEGTQSCLNCHGAIGDDILKTGHWNWQGVASGIEGYEGEIHGKNDIVNNFCIAVATNEGRCTQCHIGYGYADDTFDFSDSSNIDCLVCHDQSGTYAKDKKTAGLPVPDVDLQAVAQSVAENSGVPTRKACLACHAKAGGGDNVKHGDLSTDMIATTFEFDVHMGIDSSNLGCVACHDVERGADGSVLSHGIGGMEFHSTDEGNLKTCTDCHGDPFNIHVGTSVEDTVASHTRLACQTCHIPTFARKVPTKTEWYWADAGQDIDPIPVDPDTGMPLYDKMKGTFVWANDVRPTLRFHNGKWDKMMVNVDDQYTATPVLLAAPVADYTDPDAMIYPFKKMIGNQVADANNNTVLVPHLFGLKGGDNPYWVAYDWDLALQDGAAYTGQAYTGAYEFVNTEMFLSVNHEVAPKEQAYGLGGFDGCTDCHSDGQIDWIGLGWTDDPLGGGTRP